MVEQLTSPPLVRGRWLPMAYDEWVDVVGESMQGEWVDGKGIVFMPPTEEHQAGAILLTELIGGYSRLFGLGKVLIAPFEVRLREGASRREPDVLYVRPEHAYRWQGKRLIGPPDFVAEFISDDTATNDRRDKFAEYQAAGAAEYLMIDRRLRPGRFDFFRLDEIGTYRRVEPDARGRYHSAAIPGFWLDARWFWQEPLPAVEDLLLEIAPDAYEAWMLAKFRARRERHGDC